VTVIITMRKEIVISQPEDVVFHFISNGSNDPKWRTEVYRMDVSGPPCVGTEWTEYSKFFKFIKVVILAVVKEFNPPNRIVIETPSDHPALLRNIRETKSHGMKSTLLSYELEFERIFLRQLSPIIPPASLIKRFYLPRISKYLNNAKRLLESGQMI